MLKTDELEKLTVRDHEHQKQHFVRPLCHIYLSVNFLILYIFFSVTFKAEIKSFECGSLFTQPIKLNNKHTAHWSCSVEKVLLKILQN